MMLQPQSTVGDELVDWFASLPFVIELPRTFGSTTTRRLAVHCELLSVSEMCLMFETQRRSRRSQLSVVMPERYKTLAVVTGWFESIASMHGGRLRCRLDLRSRERVELEVILSSVYTLAFPAVIATGAA